jgi:hypothetical protein
LTKIRKRAYEWAQKDTALKGKMTTKIECPNCQQHIELETPPAPADAGFLVRPEIRAEKLQTIHDEAESVRTQAVVIRNIGWFLLFIGAVAGVSEATSYEGRAESGWAIFASFVGIWIVCCVLSRLARIHAALINLRADALDKK